MEETERQVREYIESSPTIPVFKQTDGFNAISPIDLIDWVLNAAGGRPGFTSQDTPEIPSLEEIQDNYIMNSTPHFTVDLRSGSITGSGGFAHDAYSDAGNVGYVSKSGPQPIVAGDLVRGDDGNRYRIVSVAGHNYAVTRT